MMRNLYLTKDCCPQWKKEHALKELIELVTSKDGTASLRTSAGHSYLVLTTPKPILSVVDVLHGIDSTDNSIMDEGMKLALLVLFRENIKVYFTNKDILCTFDFRIPRGSQVEMLHLIPRPFLELPIQGTTIEIANVTQEDLDRIKALDNIDFMRHDKEQLTIELKTIENKVKENAAKLDAILDEIIKKISAPVLFLQWSFLSKEEMEKWIKGEGIIGYVRKYLEKNQIDLGIYAKDERVSKYIKSICLDCYKNYSDRYNNL